MIRVREKLESDGDYRRRGDNSRHNQSTVTDCEARRHFDRKTSGFKLQDEKRREIECHGWERRRVVSPSARIYQSTIDPSWKRKLKLTHFANLVYTAYLSSASITHNTHSFSMTDHSSDAAIGLPLIGKLSRGGPSRGFQYPRYASCSRCLSVSHG